MKVAIMQLTLLVVSCHPLLPLAEFADLRHFCVHGQAYVAVLSNVIKNIPYAESIDLLVSQGRWVWGEQQVQASQVLEKEPSKYVDFKSVLSFSSGSEFFWLWLIRVFEILHNCPLPTNAVTKTVETLKVMNSYSPHPLLTT